MNKPEDPRIDVSDLPAYRRPFYGILLQIKRRFPYRNKADIHNHINRMHEIDKEYYGRFEI